MNSQVVKFIGKIMVCAVFCFATLAQAEAMNVQRGPASKDAAIVIEYLEVGHKASAAPLVIYIYPYGNYIAYRGAVMHCQSKSGEPGVTWSCVGDEGRGYSELDLSGGFTSPKITKYEIFKNCDTNCKSKTGASMPLKLQKASLR